MKPKLLFLFPDGWDEAALAAVPSLRDEFDVVCEGFDLFRFPENANLLWFDARRFVARLARRYRHAGIAGVASTNEQYGALLAAVLARELGLQGSDPAAIIRAQHKYYARCSLSRALPEANPAFALLPYAFGRTSVATSDPCLPFPFFVKPVKAAYSVLATSVANADELQRHLTFHPWETHIIKRLVRPFGDLMREYGSEFTVDPEHMLAEGLLDGVQINVDGWMDRGRIGFFGIVDAVMFPGTRAFQRFEYPSCLPASAQGDAFAVAERAMRAVGFDHGAFNIELYWQRGTSRFFIIEINPRLAAQFGDLYANVDGTHPYSLLADLSVGRTPRWTRGQGRFGAAASFVFREFNGAVKIAPSRAQIRWLGERYPDASLHTFIKHGNSRWRETKWLGSYRYAIINLGGASREDLARRYDEVCSNVSFEGDRKVRFAPDIDSLRPGASP
jgi:hypothetical protein